MWYQIASSASNQRTTADIRLCPTYKMASRTLKRRIFYHAPSHCQLLFYFSNINHVAWVVNNFSMMEETHVWGNPYKAPFVLLREVYRFCCCCPTYIFSLDIPVLEQDLGKFQKHCWLRASGMYCNVCFIVKLQLAKEV